MRPLFLAAAFTVAVIVPSAAQEVGRYEVSPAPDGFIRLDTRTGATAHCTRHEGVWRCAPVIEEAGALAARIDSLSEKVDGIMAAVADLDARVGALSARLDAPPATVAAPPATAERGFLATAMARLIAVVRALKHGRAAA